MPQQDVNRWKLLFITTGTGIGGAERMLARLVESMDADRFAVEVLSLTELGPVGEEMKRHGLAVRSIGVPARISGGVHALVRLGKEIRRARPDVVQTWMYHADLLGGIAARACGVPVVWGVRQSNLDPRRSKRSTILVSRACARLSGRVPVRILCCSKAAIATHVALGYDEKKMLYVPNGFDADAFAPDPKASARFRELHRIPADAPIIGNLSRFDPQKDIETFLNAAARYVRRRADCRFVLAGRGMNPENAQLRALLDDAGISSSFLLLGEVDDVRNVLCAFDILTLTSAYGEGFPNVVGEAMLCRIPCVVTNIGDSASIVGEEGVVVEPGSPRAVAEAWDFILGLEPAARAARVSAGRSRIVRDFSISSVVRRYEQIYLDVVGAAPCAA